MKKTVMICDRCGKQYDPAADAKVSVSKSLDLAVDRVRITVTYVRAEGFRERKSYDLCPKCAEHITGELFKEAGE